MQFHLRKGQNVKQVWNNAHQYAQERFKEHDVCVSIEKCKKTRTGQQNAYFWALATILAKHAGYQKEDIKDYLVEELGFMREVKIGLTVKRYPKSTTSLNTTEFGQLIDASIGLCVQNGLDYPEPIYQGLEI